MHGPRYPGGMTGWAGLGSNAHRALIGQVVAHYQHDSRVRAVAVFGSVSAGTWHELSDVDFDIVIEDDARVVPAEEIAALFGARATIVLARGDSADVVLDSLEEVSARWHTLRTTSPNITATARVVAGRLTDGDLVAAGEANRADLMNYARNLPYGYLPGLLYRLPSWAFVL